MTITEPIILEDLRWLVNECRELDSKSRVTVTGHKEYSPMESDPATITVHGEL